MIVDHKESEILRHIYLNGFTSQRKIANDIKLSLGLVNKYIKALTRDGILSENEITEIGLKMIENGKVKSAIILAAGYGIRMIPVNNEIPKALIKIKGTPIIERIIEQLHKREIDKIYVVVGFMKERFEYLIDKYNIELIVNSEYKNYNNSKSLLLAQKCINNSYIIPGDLYFLENPFNSFELCSYYTLEPKVTNHGYYGIDKKFFLKNKPNNNAFHNAIGLSFIGADISGKLVDNLKSIITYDPNAYWEEAFFVNKMDILVRFIDERNYYEINTLEDLRKVDSESDSISGENLTIITNCFMCNFKDIKNITVLKKGMTNRSCMFEINGQKYIMRIPGEGTSQLISRHEEAEVYDVVNKTNICDKVVYINPKSGIKITEFFNNSHNCDSENENEVKMCMEKLKSFHKLNLKVGHTFDLKENILKYEKLMGEKSMFIDYFETKSNIFDLLEIIENIKKQWCLCHIDSVPDNFLIDDECNIKLIDWEYAGMQDPHIDIAMFAIYAGYDKKKIDKLIDFYFENKVDNDTKFKIYAYVAICGFLWSNWCEYKYSLGVEFGEYSLNQYRYAKVFSKISLRYFRSEK